MKHNFKRVLFFSLLVLTLVCLSALAASAAYRVNSTGEDYSSLDEAVAAANVDDTIVLTSSETISTAMTLSKSVKIQQTDPSFKLTISKQVTITGNVTFKGVHISQKGVSTIINITNGTTVFDNCTFESHTAVGAPRTITIKGDGTNPVLTFKGGSYDVPPDTGSDARFVSGYLNYTINVEGGTFTAGNTVRAIFRLGNSGSLNITGGTFETSGQNIIFCDSHSGNVTISKGSGEAPSFSKSGVKNTGIMDLNTSGTITVNAGTFTSTTSFDKAQSTVSGMIFDVRNSGTKLIINDGDFSNYRNPDPAYDAYTFAYTPIIAARNATSSSIKINGGTFHSEWRVVNITASGDTNLEITGGEFTASERCIWANAGNPTITITGGTFGSETSGAQTEVGTSRGTLDISGDTVIKTNFYRAIILEGDAVLKLHGNAKVYNYSSSSTRYGVQFNNNTGTADIYENAYIEAGYEAMTWRGTASTAVKIYGNAKLIAKGTDVVVYAVPDATGSLTIDENAHLENLGNKNCLSLAGLTALTINNGTLKSNTAPTVYATSVGINVTIRGGYFENSGAEFTLRFVKSNVNIYGGYFHLFEGTRTASNSYMVRLEGGTVATDETEATPATMNIYGGTFISDNQQKGAVIRNGLGADTDDTVNIYGGTFIANGPYTRIFWDCNDNATTQTNLYAYNARGGLVVHAKGTATSGAKVKYPSVMKAISYKSISIEPSAELRLVSGSAGIRFTSTISAGFVSYVESVAKAGTVKYSTIIVPTDYLDGLVTLSPETLDTLGKDYLVIDAEEGINENIDGSLTICATIAPINEWNIARKFSAVVMATYEDKAGNTVSICGDFHQASNSRSAANLAKKALKNPFIYTEEQLDILETFAAKADADKPVDIYVIAGQSNASGYGTYNDYFAELNSDYTNGYSKILYSGAGGSGSDFSITSSPIVELGKTKLGLGGSKNNVGAEVGMAEYFSKYMYDEDSDRVACIVKWADGGTNLLDVLTGSNVRNGNWLPPSFIEEYGANGELSGQQYRSLLEVMQNAIDNLEADGYDVSIKGVFWMQGEAERALSSIVFEGDTYKFGSVDVEVENRDPETSYTVGTADYEILSFDDSIPYSYPNVFRMLMEDMRYDFGEMSGEDLSDMPFVIGEISASFGRNFNAYEAEFINMQRAMAEEFDSVYTVSSSVLSTGYYSGDNAHWTAEDITLIGQMVAKAFMLHYDDSLDIPEPYADEDAIIAIVYDGNGDEIGAYSSLSYAINSAPEGATIELQDDVTINSAALNIANPNSITLDGCGYTIYSNSPDHAVRFVGTDITLYDLNITNNTKEYGAYCGFLYDSAIVTIDGAGDYNAYAYAFVLNQANCTLNILSDDCVFETEYAENATYAPIWSGSTATLNIEGGEFVAAENGSCISVSAPLSSITSVLNITGGSFYSAASENEEGGYCINIESQYVKGSISGATFVGQDGKYAVNNPNASGIAMNVSSCVVTGTSVSLFTQDRSGTTFEVRTSGNTLVGTYDDFAYAINSCPAGGTVKVLKNFAISEMMIITNSDPVTINGNGKIMTINMNGTRNERLHTMRLYGAQLTFSNLSVTQAAAEEVVENDVYYGETYFAYFYEEASVTINGGTWTMAYWGFVISSSGCSLTINSGTFKTLYSYSANYAFIKLNAASTVTINGGTFYGPTETTNASTLGACIRVQPDKYYDAVLKVNNGTFVGGSAGAYCIRVDLNYAPPATVNSKVTCTTGILYYEDPIQ